MMSLYGDVSKGASTNYVVVKTKAVHFQRADIGIPCCRSCERRHKVELTLQMIAFWGGLPAAYFGGDYLYNLMYPYDLPGYGRYGMMAAVFLAAFLTATLIPQVVAMLAGSRPKSHEERYPPAKDLIDRGWKVGERPFGTF